LTAVVCSANAGPISGQGTWETTLLGRDIDGHALAANNANAVFLYDTTLNITWLKDGTLSGPMTWFDAINWASALKIGAFSGWRLPTTQEQDPSCQPANSNPTVYSQGYGVGCSGSEMGSLFNMTLGNGTGAITNSGDFEGLQNYYYWSGTSLTADPYYAWTYSLAINGQGYTGTGTNAFYSLAVRDGDVMGTIPEPGSVSLVFLGLAMIVTRRKAESGS
jgi:hypothetical protein